jgi:hypothetical protein
MVDKPVQGRADTSDRRRSDRENPADTVSGWVEGGVVVEATALTKLALSVQHLLVAGVVVPLFGRTLPTRT